MQIYLKWNKTIFTLQAVILRPKSWDIMIHTALLWDARMRMWRAIKCSVTLQFSTFPPQTKILRRLSLILADQKGHHNYAMWISILPTEFLPQVRWKGIWFCFKGTMALSGLPIILCIIYRRIILILIPVISSCSISHSKSKKLCAVWYNSHI